MHTRALIGLMLALGGLAGVAPGVQAELPDAEQAAVGRIPPRLSFTDGQVSFWRPGAKDWAQGQVNGSSPGLKGPWTGATSSWPR